MKNKAEFTAFVFSAAFVLVMAVLCGGCNRRERTVTSHGSGHSPVEVHSELISQAEEERVVRARTVAESYRKDAEEREEKRLAELSSEEPVEVPLDEQSVAGQLPVKAAAVLLKEAVNGRPRKAGQVIPSASGARRPGRLDPGASPVMKSADRLLRIFEATIEGVDKSMRGNLTLTESAAEAAENNAGTERTYK